MKVLWSKNEALTSNQILDEVRDILDWKLASLMTALARMVDKGYVYCDRSTRTNYYSAVISEEQYKIEESESFLEKLYDKSTTKLVASLFADAYFSGNIDGVKLYLAKSYTQDIECYQPNAGESTDVEIMQVKGLQNIKVHNMRTSCHISVEFRALYTDGF